MKRHISLALHFLGCIAIPATLAVTTSAMPLSVVAPEPIHIASAESVVGSIASAARQYQVHQHTDLKVSTVHSGQAINQLLAGQADLAIISRPLTNCEAARASELGKTMYMLTLGFDGVVVVVHPTVGRELKELGLDELRKVFITGEFQDWKQLMQGKHQGAIRVLVPPLESGITTSFLRGLGTDQQPSRPLVVLPDLHNLVRQVAADPLAIGITASGAERNGLATLSIRDDRGTVHRCQESSLRQGHYPFVRSVFAVVVDRLQSQHHTDNRFHRFLGSVEGQEVLYAAGMITTMQVTAPTAANATLDEKGSKKSHGKHH